jgi:hypothetical protein
MLNNSILNNAFQTRCNWVELCKPSLFNFLSTLLLKRTKKSLLSDFINFAIYFRSYFFHYYRIIKRKSTNISNRFFFNKIVHRKHISFTHCYFVRYFAFYIKHILLLWFQGTNSIPNMPVYLSRRSQTGMHRFQIHTQTGMHRFQIHTQVF